MSRERIKSIKLIDITQSFAQGPDIFRNINLSVPLGKITFLEGGPGSGKSLLLHIMAGLVEPTGGGVAFNDRLISEMSFEEFVPLRQSTSICFENGGLLMNKTLTENLQLPLVYHRGWREIRSDAFFKELVELFGIGSFLHLRPASVSAGVRKIAGLVRAFLSNPQVVFLDEPSVGIGEDASKALKYCIKNYRKLGKGDEIFIIACSDRKFIEEFEGERLRIDKGRLV